MIAAKVLFIISVTMLLKDVSAVDFKCPSSDEYDIKTYLVRRYLADRSILFSQKPNILMEFPKNKKLYLELLKTDLETFWETTWKRRPDKKLEKLFKEIPTRCENGQINDKAIQTDLKELEKQAFDTLEEALKIRYGKIKALLESRGQFNFEDRLTTIRNGPSRLAFVHACNIYENSKLKLGIGPQIANLVDELERNVKNGQWKVLGF